MKRFTILLLSALHLLSAYANEITCSQDTIIRTTTTSIVSGDTIITTVETRTKVEEKEEPQSSSVMFDGSSYNVIFSWNKKHENRLSPHWTGVGMGFMNYNSDNIPYGSLKMSTSHNFTINLIDFHKQLGNHWLLVSGLGTEWSRYHFDENAALTKRDGKTIFETAPEGIDYKSTKLLAYYITVPLLLEYQTRSFHISGGAVAFFKYYSKSQVKYYIDGEKHVQNKGRDLNIRPVDLRLRLQVGFDNVALYGYYAPISMFSKNKGPEVNTYTIGLMLGV